MKRFTFAVCNVHYKGIFSCLIRNKLYNIIGAKILDSAPVFPIISLPYELILEIFILSVSIQRKINCFTCSIRGFRKDSEIINSTSFIYNFISNTFADDLNAIINIDNNFVTSSFIRLPRNSITFTKTF